MLTRELFNLIIILIIIIYITTSYILYKKINQSHNSYYSNLPAYSFRNHLKRAKNGLLRFLNRLRVIWPMHFFFLMAFLIILFLNRVQLINNIEQYLLSLINLMVIIYFIDFINSEQSRRESANKRYLIDVEISQVIFHLSFVFDLLLDRDFLRRDNEAIYPEYRMSQQLSENEIHEIINTEGFWVRDVSFFLNVYETQVTSPEFFLKKHIYNSLTEVQLFLTKYSTIILYDDFRLIHQLEFQLKRLDDVLKYDINFIEDNISDLFFDLIHLNKNSEIILDKWHK